MVDSSKNQQPSPHCFQSTSSGCPLGSKISNCYGIMQLDQVLRVVRRYDVLSSNLLYFSNKLGRLHADCSLVLPFMFVFSKQGSNSSLSCFSFGFEEVFLLIQSSHYAGMLSMASFS